MIEVAQGDCRTILATIREGAFDAIITDPPYELGFMGRKWDSSGVAYDQTVWREALRVAKPGAWLAAFGGTRTFHRMACAIEDAGWELRDTLAWIYGSGMPKSHDVSKAIDKHLGAKRETVRFAARPAGSDSAQAHGGNTRPYIEAARERGYHEAPGPVPASPQAAAWEGWGTALKPSIEPIVLARKPLVGTVAENVLTHGTGGIHVDAVRVAGENPAADRRETARRTGNTPGRPGEQGRSITNRISPERYMEERPGESLGRWPPNTLLQHGDACTEKACVDGCPVAAIDAQAGDDVSRFFPVFYAAKASRKDRGEGNTHPTVKPLAVMRWLVRLLTPSGGLILDPFAGSGTTLLAAREEGFSGLGLELEPAHVEIARRRIGC